jgi:DNA-binding winged helix-turn-helix (wHTH) protein
MASVFADHADAARPVDLAAKSPFDLGELNIRPAIREIASGDRSEILEPRVMQVLVALAEACGQVVSRERLIDRCWGGRIISEDAINTCISKVRRIGEAYGAFTIQTVPRVGYRLATTAASTTSRQRRSWLGRALLALALAVMTLGLGAGAIWRLWSKPDFTVAVGAFDAEPGDPAATSLAKRVGETLTGAMTARHVDVTPPASKSSAPIAVSGSVEAHGADARVEMTIEDRRARLVIWQGQFEGKSGFDSTLPDQVSAKATSMITTARELYDSSRGGAKPQVLKAYVLGMENFREHHNLTEHLSFIRSMREMAPEIPLVHAIYAQTLMTAADDQTPAIVRAWRKEAMTEAKDAIRGDRTIGLAYAAESNAMEPTRFAERFAVMDQGLRFAPTDGHLNAYYGLLKSDVGRPWEGMPFTRRGHLADPDAAPRTYAEINQLISAGLSAEAGAALEQARRVAPDNFQNSQSLIMLAVSSQEPRAGKATIEAVQGAYPDAVATELWLDFFDSLRCRCHLEATALQIDKAARAGRAPLAVAYLALSRLGAHDQAFAVASLVKYAQVSNDYRMLFAPAAAPMRRDRRFMNLAARLGLAQYWLGSGQWPEFCAEQTLPYDCKAEATRALAERRAS